MVPVRDGKVSNKMLVVILLGIMAMIWFVYAGTRAKTNILCFLSMLSAFICGLCVIIGIDYTRGF